MTAATEQFVDIAKRGQDLVTESVRSWTETVQGFGRQFTDGDRPSLPDAGVAVDRVFDFYEQVLGHQRELAKTVVGAGSSLVDQVTEQASRATEAVAGSVSETVSDSASEQAPKRAPRTSAK
ncbi:hypothetical protein [Pseudonocardia sp. HH130630-07]|uniref:hypothetical protein n=1 Tax=Pseudonocardia sp. HH130630-07 TaxID=1690815 RepID=UPI000814CE7A|nr:hypothetical protein [Pseudonocardia sp. HH130630-07]ANY08650.1 hypothetical protein AFB00_22965 [Pseudonocardia sp. HH130630-07]